jgi:hypothetical protein
VTPVAPVVRLTSFSDVLRSGVAGSCAHSVPHMAMIKTAGIKSDGIAMKTTDEWVKVPHVGLTQSAPTGGSDRGISDSCTFRERLPFYRTSAPLQTLNLKKYCPDAP